MRKFPKTREDGSFSINVSFDSPGISPDHIEDWLASWALKNEELVFHYDSGAPSDYLRLAESFLRPPYQIHSTPDEVVIRFDATSEAPFWKDWYARLVADIVAEFPRLTLKSAADAE